MGGKNGVKRCVFKNVNYFYIGERAAFPQTFLYALALIKTIKKKRKKLRSHDHISCILPYTAKIYTLIRFLIYSIFQNVKAAKNIFAKIFSKIYLHKNMFDHRSQISFSGVCIKTLQKIINHMTWNRPLSGKHHN